MAKPTGGELETQNLGIDWTPGALRSFTEKERRILAYLYQHRDQRVSRRDIARMLGRNGRTNHRDNAALRNLVHRGYIIERRRWKVERLPTEIVKATYLGGGTEHRPQRRRFWYVYEINPNFISDWKRAQRRPKATPAASNTKRSRRDEPKPEYIGNEWTVLTATVLAIIRRIPLLKRLA